MILPFTPSAKVMYVSVVVETIGKSASCEGTLGNGAGDLSARSENKPHIFLGDKVCAIGEIFERNIPVMIR